jgi:hypothetical protein
MAVLLLMARGRFAFGQAREGARPLRVRVGGFVAFAAQGCWWLSEDAPGVDEFFGTGGGGVVM